MDERLQALASETKASRPDMVAEIDELMAIAQSVGDHPFVGQSIEKFLRKIGASTDPDDRQELERMNEKLRKMLAMIGSKSEGGKGRAGAAVVPLRILIVIAGLGVMAALLWRHLPIGF